jgi:hypothetical protein
MNLARVQPVGRLYLDKLQLSISDQGEVRPANVSNVVEAPGSDARSLLTCKRLPHANDHVIGEGFCLHLSASVITKHSAKSPSNCDFVGIAYG